jgi:hypothetical protein
MKPWVQFTTPQKLEAKDKINFKYKNPQEDIFFCLLLSLFVV